MSNRPAGGERSKRHVREPLDWYVDGPSVTRQLMASVDFGEDLVWDPSCGRGTILDVAAARGHDTFGSDLRDRGSSHEFKKQDFITCRAPPIPRRGGLSIINNPPYSYIDGIAQDFIIKALTMPINKAAFILPIAFLASIDRFLFFTQYYNPSHVAIFSERPSMPPGSTINETTTFSGGMADYCAIIYQPPHKWRTELIWLKPDSIEIPKG